eukprot:scaffold189939_cov19-Tisochrysis_lutea.AAC.5
MQQHTCSHTQLRDEGQPPLRDSAYAAPPLPWLCLAHSPVKPILQRQSGHKGSEMVAHTSSIAAMEPRNLTPTLAMADPQM